MMSDDNQKPGQSTDLDLSYLNDISGGNVEFMIEMIDIFLEQTPIYFSQLGEAIKTSEWKAVADAAHKIKPTLAFMGVDKAREDMQVLEKNARSLTNLETIDPDYQALKAICDDLFVKLGAVRKDLESQL